MSYEIDDQTKSLFNQSKSVATDLAILLDSERWKYVKFFNMVEFERINTQYFWIKLELNVLANVNKIVSFLNDTQRINSSDKSHGTFDIKWKIGDKLSVAHHVIDYGLPEGKRDFAVWIWQYDLSNESVAFVTHSIDTNFSDSKGNTIPEQDDWIRGEHESLFLIEKISDKSSVLHVILKYDLYGDIQEKDIKKLEEIKFDHFWNIKIAIEDEK